MNLFRKKKCNCNQDIIGISIVCNHSCRERCYTYTLRKNGTAWYFSVLCNNSEDNLTSDFEDIRISEEDADNILSVCKKSDFSVKPDKPRNVTISDETEYSTCIKYSDRTCIVSDKTPGKEIIDAFSALAGKCNKQ